MVLVLAAPRRRHRVHLADIRIPGMPTFFGYIQTPGAVNPVTALSVTEDVADHGFPSAARIEIAAGARVMTSGST